METGETPSLGPSCCFVHLILSLVLRLANLYEVPSPKCEGDGKGLQALFVFLHQFLSLSCLSRSLHWLSLSSFTSSTSLHSQSVHVTYKTFTKHEYINLILSIYMRFHYQKLKATTKVYKPCLSFFISFSFSCLSRSVHCLSLSSLTSSTPQHSETVHATYEMLNSLSIIFYRSHSPYTRRTKP